MDLELLKEIPGYKAILKSVIKTQIQFLIEQLSNHTGEESIILTASLSEGTLSHLGSTFGKGFYEGRDEVKSQFLGYCIRNQQKRTMPDTRSPFQGESPTDMYQTAPLQKRQKVHPVSLSRAEPEYGISNFDSVGMPGPGQMPQGSFGPGPVIVQTFSQAPSPHPAPRIRKPSSAGSSPGVQNSPANNSMLKTETSTDSQELTSSFSNSEDSSGVKSFQPPSLPPSVHLTHTQTGPPLDISSDNGTEFANTKPIETRQVSDNYNDPSIKLEPVDENELDLEITGVELGAGAEGFSRNCGQDMTGYPGSESGESQSGSQYNQGGLDQFVSMETSNFLAMKPQNSLIGRNQTQQPRAFSCQFCGLTFTFRCYLDRHLVRHTGIKPFTCELCTRGFTRRSTLKFHMAREHKRLM